MFILFYNCETSLQKIKKYITSIPSELGFASPAPFDIMREE